MYSDILVNSCCYSVLFQVMPMCFLLRQHISMRPLINRNTVKRHFQQENKKTIAIPVYFQESSKPAKHTSKGRPLER